MEMMRNRETLVIGSCTVDIVVPTVKLPTTTQSVNSGKHHFALGGCAYNVSQMLRLLGAPYLHAFTVGSGLYGSFVREQMALNGLPVFRESDEPHGACLCFVEEGGERSFVAYRGIEYKFSRDWLKDVDISRFGQVFLCGLELEEDTGTEIVSFLEGHTIPDIFFAPGPRLMTLDPSIMERILSLKPIIHLNEKEVCEYTGKADSEEAISALHEITGNMVIVTRGKDGSMLLDDGGLISLPARQSVVVDSIGAGDCHLGTFMACRANGNSAKDSLAMANLMASEVVRHPGPTLSENDVMGLLLSLA